MPLTFLPLQALSNKSSQVVTSIVTWAVVLNLFIRLPYVGKYLPGKNASLAMLIGIVGGFYMHGAYRGVFRAPLTPLFDAFHSVMKSLTFGYWKGI